MAKQDRATIEALIDTLLPDNTTQEIEPADVRDVNNALNESAVNWLDDVDEDATLAANSNEKVATQRATKTYIDNVIQKVTVRITPTEFAQLNSNPKQLVAGIAGYACLLVGGCAIPYTGDTPYNENNALGVLDDVNFNNQGQTDGSLVTGRNAIIQVQKVVNCLSDGNGLVATMGSNLTGGNYGYDVTILYTFVKLNP
jgi:hypothetical protein